MPSVCHTVMLKLRDGIDEVKLLELLDQTRKNVPGLIELHFGRNDMGMYQGKVESPDGNTHALFSRHESGKYLSLYQRHPDHILLAKFLFSYAERPPTVVDFVNVSRL